MKASFFMFLVLLNFPTLAIERLINGTVVDQNDWLEVVNISGCTGTVIGPKVIVTASHCVNEGQQRQITVSGNVYNITTFRHPKYNPTGGPWGYSHDIAIGISDTEITGVQPATFKTSPLKIGDTITILGYGCTQPGGGSTDGNLRIGDTSIAQFGGTDMLLKKSGGAAVCYGDSGGPNMKIEGENHFVVGITSKGDISSTSYNLRGDLDVIRKFLEEIASSKDVDICGINKRC